MNTPTARWFMVAFAIYLIGVGLIIRYLSFDPPTKRRRKRSTPRIPTRSTASKLKSMTFQWADTPFNLGKNMRRRTGPSVTETVGLMQDYKES